MTQPQHISNAARELEARMLFERDNDYEPDVEHYMNIYRDVVKHIGFTDRRRDDRFIVKFHDIFYYEPDEVREDNDANARYNELFDWFCHDQYDCIHDAIAEAGILITDLLHYREVGSYRPFKLYIKSITQDNVADVARRIFDEYLGHDYATNYVFVVNTLQDLEDNYMEYWIEFLRDNDYPDTYIKQIEDAYNKDHNNQPQQPKEK